MEKLKLTNFFANLNYIDSITCQLKYVNNFLYKKSNLFLTNQQTRQISPKCNSELKTTPSITTFRYSYPNNSIHNKKPLRYIPEWLSKPTNSQTRPNMHVK